MKKLLTSVCVAGMVALSCSASASTVWEVNQPSANIYYASSIEGQGIPFVLTKGLYVNFDKCIITTGQGRFARGPDGIWLGEYSNIKQECSPYAIRWSADRANGGVVDVVAYREDVSSKVVSYEAVLRDEDTLKVLGREGNKLKFVEFK